MAQYTIQDILGSDNVAASRAVIQSNAKLLCDGLNKIETFLNTSPNGGTLNIGNILVKKYSSPVTDEIFRIEASGRVEGSLTIIKTLNVGTGIAGENSKFLSDVTINRQFIIERSKNTTNVTNLSTFKSGITITDIFALEGSITWPVTSGSPGTSSSLNVLGYENETFGRNNITFAWAGGEVETARFSNGYDGQILIVKNKGVQPTSERVAYEDSTTSETIISFEGINDTLKLSKLIVTFIFVADNPTVSKTIGTWKVLNYVLPSGATVSY